MKIVNTLIAFTIILFVSACGTNQTQQNPTASSPSAASSPTLASSPTTAAKINVTETEMAIKLPSATASAGQIDFVVHNSGKIPHEFVVLRTEVPDNQLPLKGNRLDEEGKGVKQIDEIEEDDLKSGATKTLSVNLTPGRYLLVCNLPGHYQAGMKTYLTVT